MSWKALDESRFRKSVLFPALPLACGASLAAHVPLVLLLCST